MQIGSFERILNRETRKVRTLDLELLLPRDSPGSSYGLRFVEGALRCCFVMSLGMLMLRGVRLV